MALFTIQLIHLFKSFCSCWFVRVLLQPIFLSRFSDIWFVSAVSFVFDNWKFYRRNAFHLGKGDGRFSFSGIFYGFNWSYLGWSSSGGVGSRLTGLWFLLLFFKLSHGMLNSSLCSLRLWAICTLVYFAVFLTFLFNNSIYIDVWTVVLNSREPSWFLILGWIFWLLILTLACEVEGKSRVRPSWRIKSLSIYQLIFIMITGFQINIIRIVYRLTIKALDLLENLRINLHFKFSFKFSYLLILLINKFIHILQ